MGGTDRKTFSLDRAELLTDAENERPELSRLYTSRLPQPAPSHEERLLLSEHLGLDPDGSVMEAARTFYATKLKERINLMIPETGFVKEKVPFEKLGLPRVKSWNTDHRELVEALLAALNNAALPMEHAPELLYSLQLLISSGPTEFAALARPSVELWIKGLPGERAGAQDQENPFATFHHTGPGVGAVQEALGWVIFQYVLLEGAQAADLVDRLAEHALHHHWREPVGILSRCLIVLASKLSIDEAKDRMSLVHRLLDILRAQMSGDEDVAANVTGVLDFIIGLIGRHRSQWIDWESDPGTFIATTLIASLGILLPPVTKSCNPNLRIRAARTLSLFNDWHPLPQALLLLLEQLAQDNRARVRLAAVTSVSAFQRP